MVQSIPATHHFISRETCNSDFCTLKCTPRNLDKLKLLERIDYWMSFHTLSNRIESFCHPAVNSRGMLKKHQFAAVSFRFLKEITRKLRWEKHEITMWVTPGNCCELPRNQLRCHSVAAPFFCLKLGAVLTLDLWCGLVNLPSPLSCLYYWCHPLPNTLYLFTEYPHLQCKSIISYPEDGHKRASVMFPGLYKHALFHCLDGTEADYY